MSPYKEKRLMRISHIAFGFLAVFAVASVAYAGQKYAYTDVTIGTNYAYGSAGSARASADANELISCESYTYSGTGGAFGSCQATNAAGTTRVCYAYGAALVAQIGAVNGSSYIYFAWDSSANCTEIVVNNGSQYQPN